MILNKFKEADAVIYEGKKTEVLDVIDEITVQVAIDKPVYYIRPKKSFWNKLFRFIGLHWAVEYEQAEISYRSSCLCSVWNLTKAN